MKFLPPFLRTPLLSALLALTTGPGFAQQATPPTLQRTTASPLAIAEALNAVAGFDFNDDGKTDLLTLDFTPGGQAEVRVTLGNGAGSFSGGVTASLGAVSLSGTEDSLAVGRLFEPQALGGTPLPSVAVVAGGELRLLENSGISAQRVTLTPQTAPSFAGTTLRSVAVADLNGDSRADLIVTGSIQAGAQPGAVYVVLNSPSGFQMPTQLAAPGAEAGKLAVGDVNGDGLADIVVCDPAEFCVKVYFAATAGQFPSSPVTVNAYPSTPEDIRPKAVAVGQLIPGGAAEIAMWTTAEASPTERILQFAVFEHTGGNAFTRRSVRGFGLHANTFSHDGSISLGDLNGDGRLDIAGTNPVQGAITVLSVKGDGVSPIDANLSPLTNYLTSNTPNYVSLGNLNGDLFVGTTPKLDVVAAHNGVSDKTIDVFLNATGGSAVPPGTPVITTTGWPDLGGELTATGGTPDKRRFAAIINGKATSVLPTGQALSSIGEVVGVAANGTYEFTVRVTSGTKFSEKTFSFTVDNVAVLTPGALAWWPGEDAGADVVGGHSAFALTEPAFAAGKVGRAFSFDGVDDFLGATNSSEDLDLRGNLTIEGWVRPAADAKGVRTIVAKHDSADLDLTFALQVEAGGKLTFLSRRAADAKGFAVSSAVGEVANGVWTHVAVRVRGLAVELFINGRPVGGKRLAPSFIPPSTTGQSVTIGATCTAPTGARAQFWKGEIDELTIYERPLDDVEIDLICKVGAAGKDRFDAPREFSTATPPQAAGALWSYGSLPFATYNAANFVPFPVLDTTDSALDVWKTSTAGGPEVRRNRLAMTHSTGAGATEVRYAPGQLAQLSGTDQTYSVVRWTAPEAGRYAVAGTWRCINAAGITSDLQIYQNSTSLYHLGTSSGEFLGNGNSSTHVITAVAGDTVDFVVTRNFINGDHTASLFASVVPLPEEYVPVQEPEPLAITFDAPLQTGKAWKFRVNQPGSGDHDGRIGIKLQYSATPNDPGSWIDLPAGAFTLTGSVGWQLIAKNLPVGNFSFRTATSVVGQATVFGAPSQMFAIGAATTLLEFVSRKQEVASDPTGATTHRGDLITYRFKVRNAGGLPGENVALRVLIPDGTKVKRKTKGGAVKVKKSPFPGSPNLYYILWPLGDLAPTPLAEAAIFELTVQVIEPTLKDDLKLEPDLNAPGALIRQNDYALITGDFANPSQIIPGPQPFLSATLVKPLTLSSAVLPGAEVRQGGLVTMEFTVRNSSSVPLRRGEVTIRANNGLVIQSEPGSLTIDGAPSSAGPLDALTGKLVKLKFSKTNPVSFVQQDRRQVGLFGIGGLPPGGERSVRATFRIPYDWPVGQQLTLDTVTALLVSPAARNIEATFPAVNLTLDPTAPAGKPDLLVSTTQQTAGILAGSNGVGMVTLKGEPVPNILPKRKSNEITYRVSFANYGSVPARFMQVIVAIAPQTTYEKGSARLLKKAGSDEADELEDPIQDSGQLFFTLPDLEPNSGSSNVGQTLEYTVTVNSGTDPTDAQGNPTRISFPGAFVTSRELLQPGFEFEEKVAQIVPSGKMQFTYSRSPQEFTAATPFIYHSIFFHNSGGVARGGVGVKYTVPAGLKFHSAVVSDRVNKFVRSGPFTNARITINGQPVAASGNPTSGDVVFEIGSVKAGGFGFAQIILTPDTINLPGASANFKATASWQGYDATTDFSANRQRSLQSLGAAAAAAPGEGPAEGQVTHPFQDSGLARTFILLTAPASVSAVAPGEFTYQLAWGRCEVGGGANLTHVVAFDIPEGTEYVSATNTQSATSFSTTDAANYVASEPGTPNGVVRYVGSLASHDVKVATITVRLKAGAPETIVTGSVRFLPDAAGCDRFAAPVSTRIFAAGEAFDAKATFTTGLGNGASAYLGNSGRPGVAAAQELATVTASSPSISLVGADYALISDNGAVLIPLGTGKMVAAGAGNILSNANGGLVSDNGLGFAIRAGDDTALKVVVPGQGPTATGALISNAASLFQSKTIGLFSLGGQNLLKLSQLIGNDGSTLIGLDGSTLVGNDGGTLGTFNIGINGVGFTPTSAGVAFSGVRAADLFSLGNGNLISNTDGALVVPGGVNVIGQNGATLISDNGAVLVGDNGASLVTDNGAGLVGDLVAGVIARDGASVIGQNGATLIGNDGGTLRSVAGGAFLNSGTGVVPTNAGK